MPTKKIRFAQQETGRTASPATPMATKDWEFLNLTPEVVVNPMTQDADLWTTTFPGTATLYTTTTGNLHRLMVWSGNSDAIVSAGSGGTSPTNCAINVGATEVGTVNSTGIAYTPCIGMSETRLNGTAIAVFLILDTDPTPDTINGYYFASDAGVAGTTFVGDTHTNTTIDNIASTAGLYSGQTLSGTNIAANTRILSVDSATAITTTLATTGTTAGVTITRSALAKIIDAQFPPNQSPALTIVGNMIHMDGYAMVACSNGTLWVSDLNSLTSWTAASFVSADSKPDNAVGLAQINNTVVVFGTNTIEFFQNAGLASGAPLQKIASMTIDIGVYIIDWATAGGTLDTICVVDGALYFVSNTSNQGSGEIGVYRMTRPGDARKISYGVLDKLLNQAGRGASYIGFYGSAVINGQKAIALFVQANSLNYYYLYYPASGLWWRQNVFTAYLAGNRGSLYSVVGGTTKTVIRNDLSVRATATATIRCGMDDWGTRKRKFVGKIHVVGDRKTAYTNRCLWSQDFSNVVWVSGGGGIAVSANSIAAPDTYSTVTADTLTASGANGTLIQDLGTVTSAAKTGGLWLKRKTGTGNIDLTMDGGSTWTTKSVTTTWTKFSVTQTLANEDFGIRIVTSGDAVYAWNAQVETDSVLHADILTQSAAISANNDSSIKLYSNDYSTTTTNQPVDLSVEQPFISRCGAGYDLATEFSDADTQHVRIKGFDIEYEEGT